MATPIRARLCLLLPILLAGTACGGAATGSDGEDSAGDGGELTTVRVGSVGGLTDAGLYLADERGYFEEAGLDVELERLDSGPALTNAMATGQLDVAGISVTPGLYSAFTQDIEMKIVGDKQSLRDEFSATRLAIRPALAGETTEESLENLLGGTIAVSAKASAAYLLLYDLLEAHGHSPEDFEITELAYSNMTGALSTGAIDAAVLLEPFLTQAIGTGDAEEIASLLEVTPAEGITLVPLVYGQDFLADSDAAQAFMTAYMKGVRDFNDAFTKDIDKQEVIDVVAERAVIDASVVAEAKPGGLDPDQRVNQEYLGYLQDFYYDEGLLREKIDIADMTDTSFAENAVKELGAY